MQPVLVLLLAREGNGAPENFAKAETFRELIFRVARNPIVGGGELTDDGSLESIGPVLTGLHLLQQALIKSALLRDGRLLVAEVREEFSHDGADGLVGALHFGAPDFAAFNAVAEEISKIGEPAIRRAFQFALGGEGEDGGILHHSFPCVLLHVLEVRA